MKTKQLDVVEAVNASGFPFQMAVADLVQRTRTQAQCSVLFTEHSWTDRTGQYCGFIDLVVASDVKPYIFIIECKRHAGSWAFLKKSEGRNVGGRRHAKLFAHDVDRMKGRVCQSGWVDAPLDPDSIESSFCVVYRQDKDKPMLERLGAELVQATECFAREDDFRVLETKHSECLYVPVIVTNVKLVVAEFAPEAVDVETGKLKDAADVNEYEVPFVRFRKQLSFLKPDDDRKIFENNLYRLDYAKERTVFVVQAKHLHDFLAKFEVDKGWQASMRQPLR